MNSIQQTLPQEIQNMLHSDELMLLTESIAEQHNLRPEYYGALFRVTANVLKGELKPNEYVTRISAELDLERDEAALIAQDINRDVFSQIKDALKSLHVVQTASTLTVPTTAPQTPATIPPPAFSFAKAIEIAPSIPPATVPVSTPIPHAQIITAVIPDSTPAIPVPQVESPRAHIGNIFEEKLGGAFRVKSDAVEYSAPQTPAAVASIPMVSSAPVAPSVPSTPIALTTPAAQVTPQPIPQVAPVIPAVTPTQKSKDPYRELPM